MFAGTLLITGGVVSGTTVTVNVVISKPVCASVAEQVTVVVPSGNVEPEGGEQETGPTSINGSATVGSV
jgi:hypothetical protein